MKAVRRRLVGIILLCGLALATGCGDRTPTGPQPAAPSADLIGSLLGGTGLLGCSNLPAASTTQTIGVAGGTLSVGPHKLVIPAAALLHDARAQERAACTPEAIRCYEAAIATADRTGERTVLAEALRRLAVVRHLRNESAEARELCHRSYSVACDAGNDLLAGEALNTLGGLDVKTGAIEDARKNFLRALEVGGQSRELHARVEQNLGILANIQGNVDEAVAHYEGSLAAYRASNDEHGCAIALGDRAGGERGLGAERSGGVVRAGAPVPGDGAEPGSAHAAERRPPPVPPARRARGPRVRRRQGVRARNDLLRRRARVGTVDRVDRQLHLRPLRARGAARDGPCTRPHARRDQPDYDPARRLPARPGEGAGPARDPEQARPAHARRVRRGADAPHLGSRAAGGRRIPVGLEADHPLASRAVRRHGLPRPPAGRRDPDRAANRGHRGRVRRAQHRTPLSARAVARGRPRGDRAVPRPAAGGRVRPLPS